MGRSPCCDKVGLKKGPWTPEEDQKLLAYIQENGHGSWRALPPKAGLQRCGKSCRLRWTNYLRPDIKRGKFSLQEEQTIIQLHALLGNRWSAIASHLPKRTDNEIKNYWNTHLKKRLTKMGIDPMTHKPKSHALTTGPGQSKDIANLSHMAQWESARLEAEARIVRESKLINSNPLLIAKTTTAPPATVPTPLSSRPLCLDILKVWQGAMMGKHRKNTPTTMGRGFSTASNGSLESPTSILNFADNNNNNNNNNNNVITTSSVGLVIHQNSLVVGPNYHLGNLAMKPHNNNNSNNNNNDVSNYNEDGKGIMDHNTLGIHDNMGDPIIGPAYNVPSFLEGFGDLPEPSIGQENGAAGYDDNKSNYWNNILNNVVNSPMDALGVI